MINTILGTKIETSHGFDKDGLRIPVTRIKAGPCWLVQVKTEDKDGYRAVQLGFGEKKTDKITKPLQGHFEKAGLKTAFLHLAEVRMADVTGLKPGDQIKLAEVLKVGDQIKVTGWSKGKGFAGVVKRWGFKGGPKTHGQSDRQRAPGSIGQTTTPGRVYKGKRMAGRMGGNRTTAQGLKVVEINEKDNFLEVKGVVPGSKKGFLIISKENA